MNKKIILSVFVLCLVIAGAGWYFLSQIGKEADAIIAESTDVVAPTSTPLKPAPQQVVLVGSPNNPSPQVVVSHEGTGFKGTGTPSTISDLLTRGGDQICTVTINTPDVDSTGMMYISGKKVRGIFTSKVIKTNIVIDSSMVQNDGWVYSWSSMMSHGYKAPAATMGGNQTIPISDAYSFEYNQGIEYRCNSWTVDPSFFQLPTWTTFSTTR